MHAAAAARGREEAKRSPRVRSLPSMLDLALAALTTTGARAGRPRGFERPGVRPVARRRDGGDPNARRAACSRAGTRFMLVVMLAASATKRVKPMQIRFPDDVDRSEAGGTVVVPKAPLVFLAVSGSYGGSSEVSGGDGLSIIRGDESCKSLATLDAAPWRAGVSNIILDQHRRAAFDFSLVPANEGYKLCVCPSKTMVLDGGIQRCPDEEGFEELSRFKVQDVLAGFNFKGLVTGSLTIPVQNGSCWGPVCPNTHTLSDTRYEASGATQRLDKISVVRTSKKCSEVVDNPDELGLTSSGYLPTTWPDRLIQSFDRVSGMTTGTYKICMREVGANEPFQESGVVLMTQDQVSSLSINGIIEIIGTIPRRVGSQLSLCKHYDCSAAAAAGVVVSLIPIESNCGETMTANPETRPSGSTGVSGHIRLTAGGMLAQAATDAVLGNGPRVLQVCLKREDLEGKFTTTGITLEVQDDAIGLLVNGLTPRKWWRVSTPRSSGTLLQYYSLKPGVAGDSIAFIRNTNLCISLCRTKSKETCDQTEIESSASGFLSAHAKDTVLSATECLTSDPSLGTLSCQEAPARRTVDLSGMTVGNYKACLRKAATCANRNCWSEWKSTGLQIYVQDLLTGIEINGAGGLNNSVQAQRAMIPAQMTSHTFRYFGLCCASKARLQILPANGECSDFAGSSTGMPLPLNSLSQAAPGLDFQGADVDKFLNLVVGLYQICLLPEEGASFHGTGVSLTVQDYIQGLEVNGVRPNRGLRIAIPKRKTSRLIFFRQSQPMHAGDKVSLIPLEYACFDPNQNTKSKGCGSEGNCWSSGHMVVGSRPLIGNVANQVLLGSDVVDSMKPNVYKVCFKAFSTPHQTLWWDNKFVETGLTVTIQTQLLFAMINVRNHSYVSSYWKSTMPSNSGVRLTVPKADNNMILLEKAGTVSFIGADRDCTSTSESGENPAECAGTPMYVSTKPNLPGSSTTYLLERSGLNRIIGKLGVRSAGIYQVCFAALDGSTRGQFTSTGISLHLQEDLTQVIVNGVRPNFGLRVALPKSRTNTLSFEGSIAGGQPEFSEKFYSFIKVGGDCSLLSDNSNASQSSDMSGYMSTGSVRKSVFNIPVQQTDKMHSQAPGLYQVCYRRNAAPGELFADTGLTVTIQEQILRLQVNRIRKIKSTIPRAEKNDVDFCQDADCSYLQTGYMNQSPPAWNISFIEPDQECEDLTNANPSIAIPGRSGHITTMNGKLRTAVQANAASLDSSLGSGGTLYPGVYQVCLGTSPDTFITTGLSCLVQEYMTRLIINGVTPGFGLNVAIPKSTRSPSISYGSPEFGHATDQLSFIAAVFDCEDVAHNPRHYAPNSSGHLTSTGLQKTLRDTESVKNLNAGVYQVCLKQKDGIFKTTGISAQVHGIASNFDSPTNMAGTAVIKKGSNSTLIFLGKPASLSASWPPTKAAIIAAYASCGFVGTNPPNPGLESSGHLSVTAGASAHQFQVFFNSEGDSILVEMLYQFCVQIGMDWYSTGLSVQVEWASADGVREISFDFVTAQESSRLQGSFNAIHLLMKTSEIISPSAGGILRVEGLVGSQTQDTAEFEVEGNSVKEEVMSMICAGNSSCSVTSLSNYVQSGKMLMKAELSIAVVCTDFDSSCNQCTDGKQECSEGILSAFISNGDISRDIMSSIDRGPWKGCINKCQDTKTIINSLDVFDLTSKAGKALTVSLRTAKATDFYACRHGESLVTLKAYVTIRMVISTLSQHLLKGSFSSSTGRLTVPRVPFLANQYIHVTLLLKNSFSPSPPRIPSAQILAASRNSAQVSGVAVRQTSSSILPKNRAGLLQADQLAQFVHASIQMTSGYTGERNRITLNLKSNWPAALPPDIAITVTGLLGSGTPDNARLALVDPSYVELKTFECVGGKHCIVDLDVMPTGDVAFHRATMDIEIFCSDFGSYPGKYIKTISLCAQVNGQKRCPESNRHVFEPKFYSSGPWQECSGCSTSTRTVMREYPLSAEFLDRFDSTGSKRFAVDIFASNGVSDLACYQSETVRVVKAILTVRIEYAKTHARWVRSTGTLTAPVSPQISKCSSDVPLSCLPDISFSFEIQNPLAANNGPLKSQVLARGGGLIFQTIDLASSFHIVGPRSTIEVVESTIRETTRLKNNINKLGLSMKFERGLPAGTTVIVSGLIGTQTASESCAPVSAPTCGGNHCIFSPSDSICQRGLQIRGHTMGANLAAAWDQSTGTLSFMVMTSFGQKDEFQFEIEVKNAVNAQAARFANVSGHGNGFVIPSTRMNGAVLSSDLEEASLQPPEPSISMAIIQENNKIEFESNRLVTRFKLNAPLVAGTQIQLSNLDHTIISPSTGKGWFSDALPNVKATNISTTQSIKSIGQSVGVKMYHMPWVCTVSSWGFEYDSFYEDGKPPCSVARESANPAILPANCAVFYRKSFCNVQPPHSLVVFADQCIRESQTISFSVDVQNGEIAPTNVLKPLALNVAGGSLSAHASVGIASLHPIRTKECKGRLSCLTSFVQDERYFDSNRRFLPPAAVLKTATLTIDLSCSSFSDPDQSLQRISLCILPDCKALYGDEYEWNQAYNACCNDINKCRPYVCKDSLPIPVGQNEAFSPGPWLGCQGNCSDTRLVMNLYDIMPIICQGQSDCVKPKSFSLFMSATAAADKFACSGDGFLSLHIIAKVTMYLEISYKSAAFASEPASLESVTFSQSTDVMQAMSKVTVVVNSMISFPLHSEVIITGLKGSLTTDSRTSDGVTYVGTDFIITHPDCSISSMVDKTIRVPCPFAQEFQLTSWDQTKGELRVKLMNDIAAIGANLSFAFALRNAMAKQNIQKPQLTVRLGAHDGRLVGPVAAFDGILSSSKDSLFVEGRIFESTQVRRRMNRITVMLRVNFHLFKGSNVTLKGFLNSGTNSTVIMPVSFNDLNVLGRWNQQLGELQVHLPKFYEPSETISFVFTLQNSRHEQSNKLIIIVPSASPSPDEVISHVLSNDGFKASQVLGFVKASLRQENTVSDQLNQLECSFTPLDNIPVGSTIQLSGLAGSQTPSQDMLPLQLEDVVGTMHNLTASWNGSTGVLSFAQPTPVPGGTSSRFFFKLRNPRRKRQHSIAKLSVYHGVTTIAMHVVGSVLDASDRARFVIAKIGENSRLSSQDNILTVILQTNIELSAVEHEIRITGMLTSETSLLVLGPSAPQFEDAILAPTKTLTLRPKVSSIGHPKFTFQWVLKNPPSPTTARTVSVSLYNTNSGVYDIPETKLDGFVLSSSRSGKIVSATIEESSQIRGAKNRLTVRFRCDFAFSVDTSITLSGLTGSPKQDTDLPLLGANSSLFRASSDLTSTGSWKRDSGTLVFRVLSPAIIDAMDRMEIEFDLVNPKFSNSSKVVELSFSGFMMTSKALDQMVLLATTRPAFVSASISESSSVVGALNTITVQFSVNSELLGGGVTKVTISGLTTHDGNVDVLPADLAKLDSYSGNQLVVVMLNAVDSNVLVNFSFVLPNPDKVTYAKSPGILASTRDQYGDSVTFPEKTLEGFVLSASQPRFFIYTEIHESSKIQGSPNTLSISLQSNVEIPDGSKITISNLRGSQTQTTSCLDVTCDWAKSCGEWNIGGKLTLTVSSAIPPFQIMVVSFILTNAASRQDGVIPIISSSIGVREMALVSESVQWHDGKRAWRGDQNPITVNGPVLSASESHVWLSAWVSESSGIAGTTNSILFELKSNTALAAGSMVTVKGLTGTSQADDESFDIKVPHSSGQPQSASFAEKGRWTQNTGALIFKLKSEIPHGSTLSFIVQVNNPRNAQASVKPVISLSFSNDVQRWKIAPRQAQSKVIGTICCLAADEIPRFTLATIRESSGVKNALNVLYFTLRANIAMTVGSSVTISGLKGTQTPDNKYLVLMNSTSLYGTWVQDGVLVFKVDKDMYFCDCVDLCAQNNLAIQFQVRNSATELPNTDVFVSAKIADVSIKQTVVSGSILRSHIDPALFASVSESSKVSAESNDITIRMMANSDLDICSGRWQLQETAKKWISSYQTSSIYRDNSLADTEELGKLSDGLSATEVEISQDHNSNEKVDIYYDFGQMFRLEAVSVTANEERGSSVRKVQIQFASSQSAPESEWEVNTAATMTVCSRCLLSGRPICCETPKTSPRFDHHARFWRIRLLDNVDKDAFYTNFPKSTALAEIKFFGCPDSETTTITVSNLTTANGIIALKDVQTERGGLRLNGTQVGDELTIKVSKSIRAFDQVQFTFSTMNAGQAQVARVAGLSVKSKLYSIPQTFAFGYMLSSDEAPLFVKKTISEDKTLQSDFNTLTVTLSANVQLNPGDNIRIIFGTGTSGHLANNRKDRDSNRTGFSCWDNDKFVFVVNEDYASCTSVPSSQDLFSSAAWYRETNVPALGYVDQKPSLIAVMGRGLPRFSEMSFKIVVKNPDLAQADGLTPKVIGGTQRGQNKLLPSDMKGSIMQAPDAGASFAVRVLKDSTNMASAKNTINVRLQPGEKAELPSGTKISICGLSYDNAGKSEQIWPHNEPNGVLAQDPAGLFIQQLQVEKKSGNYDDKRFSTELLVCVVLTMDATYGPWKPGTLASVSFNFKNPPVLFDKSPELTIVASQKITIALRLCKAMNQQDTAKCLVQADALWTRTLPSFMRHSMRQDSLVVKQLSKISVTLSPNIVIGKGTKLVMSGLQGLSETSLDVKGPIAHLISPTWNQAPGTLEMTCTDEWDAKFPETDGFPNVSFYFSIHNPDDIQVDKDVKLCFGALPVPDVGFVDISNGNDVMTSRKCSSPLLLGQMVANETQKFVIKSIRQSSDVENEDNILTIDLSANFDMPKGTSLTFTGLKGSQTPDTDALTILTSFSQGITETETQQKWTQGTGELQVTLESPVYSKPASIRLSFVLQNPRKAGPSSPAKVTLTVNNVGSTSFTQEPLIGTVLDASTVAQFTSVSIGELTNVNLQLNTITLTLISNVGLSQGGNLTISGLVGRNQEETELSGKPCVADAVSDSNTTIHLAPMKFFFTSLSDHRVEQTSAENTVVVNSLSCSQVDSNIKVQVPFFVKPRSNLVLSFDVVNWKQKLPGARPVVSFSGCRARINVGGDLQCTGQSKGGMCSDCPQSEWTWIRGTTADKRALSAGAEPQVWKGAVDESTSVISQPNQITVSLSMNFQLTTGSRLTLRGFQESQTPDSSSLTLSGPNSTIFNSSGSWNGVKGQLVLTTVRQVDINESLVVSFEITNRGTRDPARCRYGANFCSGKGAYNEGKACPNLGGICSGVCTGGKPYCTQLSVSGSCSAYTEQDLQDPLKEQAANDLCIGGLCVKPNNGHQCPSTAMVNTTDKQKSMLIDPNVDKVQVQYFGKLVYLTGENCAGASITCAKQSTCVAPNEGEVCTSQLQCTGSFDPALENKYENLERRRGSQRCIRLPRERSVEIYVMSARANISWTALAGKLNGFTSPTAPEFVTRVLEESTAVAGSPNILTIRLGSNFRLYSVTQTNITLSGLPLHNYGISSRVPVVSAHAQKKNLMSNCSCMDGVATCDGIGEDVDIGESNMLLSAKLTLEMQCDKGSQTSCQGPRTWTPQSLESCTLVAMIRLFFGGKNETLPVGSYSAAPCLEDPTCKLSSQGNGIDCLIVSNLDVKNELLQSGGSGIKVVVFTKEWDPSAFSMRAILTYEETAEYGQYDRSNQTLIVAGRNAPSIRPSDTTILFKIPLQNAAVPQTAPAVTLLGESGLIKEIGICVDEIEKGCSARGVPSQSLSLMTGRVLTSDREGPMKYASIQESSTVQGSANVITIELQAEMGAGVSVNIPAGSTINISGLSGSLTPSTDSLLTSGHRIARHAKWDQTRGMLLVNVNCMPHSPEPSPLRFSFELVNAKSKQEPRVPSVLVSGVDASFGGKSRKLMCETQLGCTGVLTSSQRPSFRSVVVREKTRYAKFSNRLCFFLESSLPILTDGVKIFVTGVQGAVQNMELRRSPGTSRRVQRCEGFNGCVLQQDPSPVPGTITTRMYTDIQVACTDENKHSESYGKLIRNLQISKVQLCDHDINVSLVNPCSHTVQKWSVLNAFDAVPSFWCKGTDYIVVKIIGQGFINMTSVLNVDYIFETSPSLTSSVGSKTQELTVVANDSSHAPSAFDLYRLSFSLNYTNSPNRQDSFKPSVEARMPDGTIIGPTQANPFTDGVGGSGVRYCSGVHVVENDSNLPSGNDLLQFPQTLRIYQEIQNDDVAECIFVIQPVNPRKFLLKIVFHEYDVDESTDLVEMFDGDSPGAVRMGILFKKSNSLSKNSDYFDAKRQMFAEGCALTLRLRSRRSVTAGEQKLLSYSSGHVGFALSYTLVDPTKMDHFKAQLGFTDMVDSIADLAVQLNLRKVLASADILNTIYSTIIFDETRVGRRSLTHAVSISLSRRAGTSSAVIRVLCTSGEETVMLADLLTAKTKAGGVKAAMNAAGIPGGVSLLAPIQVFRCGKELECVPTTPAPVPVITTTPAPTPAPPTPFPLKETIQLALGVIVGPSVVGFLAILAMCYYKGRAWSEQRAKRRQAIEAFNDWMDDKMADLQALDGFDLGRLAEKEGLVAKDEWEEAAMAEMIPEIAKSAWRNQKGLGLRPEGIYKHVPAVLFAAAAKLQTPKTDKARDETPDATGKVVAQAEPAAPAPAAGISEAEGETALRDREQAQRQHTVRWIEKAKKKKKGKAKDAKEAENAGDKFLRAVDNGWRALSGPVQAIVKSETDATEVAV